MTRTQPSLAYRADLDGLRAVAVAMVVFYHCDVPGFAGGYLGVDVFLVLSGFLITGLLRAGGQGDLWGFWLRRARRLMPLMLLVAAATAVAGWYVLLPHQLKDLGQSLALTPFFATNLLFWHEAGYFTPQSDAKPLLHFWSLGVEAQFYLFFPLLLALVPRRWHAVAVAGLAALSLGAGLVAAHRAPEAAFFLFPFRFWEFAVGALIALGPPLPRGRWQGWLGICLVGAALLLARPTHPHPGLEAILAVLGTALLLHAGGAPRRFLALPAMAGVGRHAYGIYLWHFPLVVYGGLLWPGADWPLRAALVTALSLGLAALSLPLVERPLRRPGLLRAAAVSGAAMAVLAVGAGLHVAGGAAWRLPAAANQPFLHREGWDMPCHGVLSAGKLARGERCTIGASGVAPHIALVGDSHTGHLTPALGPALADRGMAALVYSRGWCAPVPGFATTAPGRGPECADFIQQAWHQILANPAITTVILSAQWGNFTDGRRAGHDAVVYGEARDPAENAGVFLSHALALSDRLAGLGLRVIVVDPSPEYENEVPDTLARRAWSSGALPERLTPIDYAGRNGAALRVLDRFTARSGAERLKLRTLFCPDGPPCEVMSAQRVPYYRDASHLSVAGAEVVVASLVRLLDTSPARQGVSNDDISKWQPTDPDR